MSTPGQAPFLDQANPLLAQVPALLATGTVSVPGAGTTGVLTVRTASTTVTVLLAAADLDNWAGAISELARAVRASSLIRPAASDVIQLARDKMGTDQPG